MSTPVDMGAIHAMGSQFKDNVFKDISRSAFRQSRILANQKPQPKLSSINTATTTTVTPGTPTKNAPGNTLAGGVTRAPGSLPRGSGGPQAIGTGKIATPYTQGATPHSMAPNRLAIGSGRKPIATPYQPPARTIPMSGNAALTNRVNPSFSFSDAGSHEPLNRTQFNQPSTTPFRQPSTPLTTNPVKQAYSSEPTPPAQVPSTEPSGGKTAPVMGNQFSDVSTKSNAPFPTHVHPAGSSNQLLPHLTAQQTQPGRPNDFVVGSRNAKPGGIAAMGSQLEAWALSRQAEIRSQRKGQ